jgi:hypothetical protein
MLAISPDFDLRKPGIHSLSSLFILFFCFHLDYYLIFFFERKINHKRKIFFSHYQLSPDIIGMSLQKNECAIFPVQQIIATSIGAMCTALLMVEK